MAIQIDVEKCTGCGSCVPACPFGVMELVDDKVRIKEGCNLCGACVDACPVIALTERSAIGVGAPDRTVTTICPYCGVGCQLKLEIKNDRIMRVVPDKKGPANKGQACVKGKFGFSFINSSAQKILDLDADRVTGQSLDVFGGLFGKAAGSWGRWWRNRKRPSTGSTAAS